MAGPRRRKTPGWKRNRFTKPQKPRPKNYRKHHMTEVMRAVADGTLPRQAAMYHLAMLERTDDQCSELDWVTLAASGTGLQSSVRQVSRWRAKCVAAGFEEHEHRCRKRPDGTIRGLPNRVRFTLPKDAERRVNARLAAGRRQAEETKAKKGPTRRAPQNQGSGDRSSQSRAARLREGINAAIAAGQTCRAPGCELGFVIVDDEPVPCAACRRTGVDEAVLATLLATDSSPP
jgi:hypothetical protein